MKKGETILQFAERTSKQYKPLTRDEAMAVYKEMFNQARPKLNRLDWVGFDENGNWESADKIKKHWKVNAMQMQEMYAWQKIARTTKYDISKT